MIWQRIDTAPKNGRLVIIALIKDKRVWRVSDAAFNGLCWYTRNGGSTFPPTHWIPMPSREPSMPEVLRQYWKDEVQEHNWNEFYDKVLKPALDRGDIVEDDISQMAIENGIVS